MIRLPSSDQYDNLIAYLEGLANINYRISSTDQNDEVHIYCQFSKPSRLSASRLCGAVLEKPFASPQKNIAYVKEQAASCGEAAEWGSARATGLFGGQTIGEIKEMQPSDIDALPWMMYRTVNDIKAKQSLRMSYKDLAKDVKVYYICCRTTQYSEEL